MPSSAGNDFFNARATPCPWTPLLYEQGLGYSSCSHLTVPIYLSNTTDINPAESFREHVPEAVIARDRTEAPSLNDALSSSSSKPNLIRNKFSLSTSSWKPSTGIGPEAQPAHSTAAMSTTLCSTKSCLGWETNWEDNKHPHPIWRPA